MSWITAARVALVTGAATLGHLHGKYMYDQKKEKNLAAPYNYVEEKSPIGLNENKVEYIVQGFW